MIFIVRCVSCNKILNSRYEAYLKVLKEERTKQGLSSEVLITSTTTPEDIRALCTSKPTPESIAMARRHPPGLLPSALSVRRRHRREQLHVKGTRRRRRHWRSPT